MNIKVKIPISMPLKRMLIVCIACILFSTLCTAQNKNDLARLNALSESYQDRNSDSALLFAERALELSQKLKDEKGRIIALNNIGWIQYRKGNYKIASEHAFLALRAAEKIKDHNEAGKANNTIASVYNDQSVPLNSLQYFNNALNEYRAASNKAGEGRVLNNLAYTSFQANHLDSALRFANAARAINQTLPNKYYLAFTFRTLGDIYKARREYSSAYSSFHDALSISKAVQNNFLTVTNLNRLGVLHKDINNTDSSIYYFTQAMNFAERYGYRSVLVQAFKGLAEGFSKKNNFQTAYRYERSYSELNDSLKNAANTETISILRSRYETEKKEAEIALQKAKLAEQNQFIATLIILILIILFFSVFLFRRYSYEKQYSKKIREQSLQLELVNKELKETLAFKDKVLSVLSHDLRTPIASLTGTMMLLDNHALNEQEFATIRSKLGRQLSALSMTLENILNWAITQGKKHTAPFKKQLDVKTILQQAINFSEENGASKRVGFSLMAPENLYAYADADQINVVARNLIANAVKFSFPDTTVEVRAEEMEDKIKISVKDKGVGISAEEQKLIFNPHIHHTSHGTMNEKGTGIGLILCKEFVEMNDGEIGFFTGDEGTTFYFTLPKFVA